MDSIQIVAFDPSLRNWGAAKGTLCLNSMTPTIEDLHVIKPVLPTGKQTRQNSIDIEAAYQLVTGAWEFARGSQAIFVEVPVGSQSSRSMASYGICAGVLGALRSSGIPFYELTPTEVKLAATKNKNATKKEMINWATETHPEAPWPTHTRNGETLITEGVAEHMADAVATVYAGIQLNTFKQALALLKPTLH